MKKLLAIIIFAGAMLTAAAQNKEYTLNIGDFSKVHVDNSIRVNYYCNPDSAGMVVISCANFESPDEILFDRNNKGRLRIQTSADVLPETPLPTLRIYSTGLKELKNAGDSLVKIHSVAPQQKLKLAVIGNGRLVAHGIQAEEVNAWIETGNGTIVLEGECTTANLRNVGAGTIQADRLRALNVNAGIYGAGTIGCDPAEMLSVEGIGAGNVTVFYRSIPAAPIKMRAINVKCEPLR